MVAIPDTTDRQTNLFGPLPEGVWAVLFCQHDDALGRPMSRNADTFGYNERGEVVFSLGHTAEAYAYDSIGNHVLAASGGVTNDYTANALNQYASILRVSDSPCETIPQYDADGNLLSDGTLDFTCDAANRLKTVSSNGVPVLANFYDANSRRVKKVTPEYTVILFYDDWNLIEERIAHTNGTTSTIQWGCRSAIRHYTGQKNSSTEIVADSIYFAANVGSSCANAAISAKVLVQSVKTYRLKSAYDGLTFRLCDGTPFVPEIQNHFIHWQLDANVGITVIKADGKAVTETIEIGISEYIFHRRP